MRTVHERGARATRPGRWAAAIVVVATLVGCATEGDEADDTDDGAAAGNGGAADGGVLRYSAMGPPTTLDPHFGTAGYDVQYKFPLFDTLITMDSATGEPQPSLVEAWHQDDPTELLLDLREGITFHDGSPLDAEAVVWNFERMIEDPGSTVSADVASIDAVDAVDETTVSLSLSEPDGDLLLNLAHRAGMMVSPRAVEELGEDFGSNPVGAGAFSFVRWEDDVVVLERSESYWQPDLPSLAGLELLSHEDRQVGVNALIAGEVDMVHSAIPGGMLELLEANPEITIDVSPSMTVDNVFVNIDEPPFDDRDFRLAVNHAIDREAIVETVYSGFGTAAHTLLPPDHWAFPVGADVEFAFDPERSRELLADSRYADSPGFTMLSLPGGDYVRQAEVIQAQLAEVGIEVDIQTGPTTEIIPRFFQDAEAPAFNASFSGRPAPGSLFELLFDPDSPVRAGTTPVEGLADDLALARQELDLEGQAEALTAAARRVHGEGGANIIPIRYSAETVAYGPHVEGFEPDLLGMARNLYAVEMSPRS